MAFLPVLLPIIISALAGGIGSAVSAHQKSKANKAQATAAQQQRGGLMEADASIGRASRRLGQTRGDVRNAMGRLDTAADTLGSADRGYEALIGQLNRHIGAVNNTDVTSGATDAITRQHAATSAARGTTGTGVANANVAGALARVNAEDQGRRQSLIGELLGLIGNSNAGRAQVGQAQGGLAQTHGQLAGLLAEIASGQGQMAFNQGQLRGHEAFAQADPSSFNPWADAIGGFFGGAFGGAAGQVGAQTSTPFGMNEWMNAFQIGNRGSGRPTNGSQHGGFYAGRRPL